MGKFSDAKKILSLVLGLMSSGTFGVSARPKNKKIDAAASSSAKSKNSNKIKKGNKKDNKKGNGKNSKKSAGANNKMRKRVLGADDVGMNKSKGAQGNSSVDKQCVSAALVGTAGVLTGFCADKLTGVSQSEYDSILNANSELSDENERLRKKIKELKAKLNQENDEKELDEDDVKELVQKAYKSDKYRYEEGGFLKKKVTKEVNWRAKRLQHNLKLAFSNYFDEKVFSMDSATFELYLIDKIYERVKNNPAVVGPGKYVLDGGGGSSVEFGLVDENGGQGIKAAPQFQWKINGEWASKSVENAIAVSGKSNIGSKATYGPQAVYENMVASSFGLFKDFSKEAEEFIEGIKDKDLRNAIELLIYIGTEFEKVGKRLYYFSGETGGNYGNAISSFVKDGHAGAKKYGKEFDEATWKAAIHVVNIISHLRYLESFVTVGQGLSRENNATKKGNNDLAVVTTVAKAAQQDGAMSGLESSLFSLANLAGAVHVVPNEYLPNYGVGKLLDKPGRC